MEVVQYCVAEPPPQKLDHASVHILHKEVHRSTSAHGVRADFFWGEADLGPCNGDSRAECCCDLGASDGGPSGLVVDCIHVDLTRGAVL